MEPNAGSPSRPAILARINRAGKSVATLPSGGMGRPFRGLLYDQESLEPLFTPGSKFPTEDPFYKHAILVLDEFLRENSDQSIKDPLKRAILQRDLWAAFSTTVSDARKRALQEKSPIGRGVVHARRLASRKLECPSTDWSAVLSWIRAS
jgi:hypothetical protein